MMAKREVTNLVLLSLAAAAITVISSLPGETSGAAVDRVRACVFRSFKSVLHLAIE
jgi:hypothetical protein